MNRSQLDNEICSTPEERGLSAVSNGAEQLLSWVAEDSLDKESLFKLLDEKVRAQGSPERCFDRRVGD